MSVTSKKKDLEDKQANELAVDAATEGTDAAIEEIGKLQSEEAEQTPKPPVDPHPGISARDKMALPPDPDEEERFRAKRSN